MKKGIKKLADSKRKDELAKELLTTQKDLELHKNWCMDYNRYCSAMIAASHNGDMPICVDPLSNIQYAEIYSKESINMIKKILHENKVLHTVMVINTTLIFSLLAIIIGFLIS